MDIPKNTNSETKEALDAKAPDDTTKLSPAGQASMQGQEFPNASNDQPLDPGYRMLTNPGYFEAREGNRNLEGGKVEGNNDLHPQAEEEDKETKPGGLKWQPSGGGIEKGC